MSESILIVGDSHASDIGKLFPAAVVKSIGGISLNDTRIRDWLENAKDYNRIYLCCSHPLCGWESKTLLINLFNLPIGTRFSNKIKEGFMESNWIDDLKQPVYELLSSLWRKQIQYFVETYPQIVLIPLQSNFVQVSITGVGPDPIDLLTGFPQIKLGHLGPEHYRDAYGHLNDQGLLSLDFTDIIQGR